MDNSIILIIGGSGSLGHKLVDRYIDKNIIYIYSRDECKHWKMEIEYLKHSNLKFIIGDIRDKDKIQQTLLRIQPDIIIMAAALKHIDRCEYETNECISTNIFGTKNVLNVIETFQSSLKVKTVNTTSPINSVTNANKITNNICSSYI